MPTAFLVSLTGHIALVLLAVLGLPSLLEPEEQRITTNAVSLVTEADLAALSQPQLPPVREADTSQVPPATNASQANVEQANSAISVASAVSQRADNALSAATATVKKIAAAQAEHVTAQLARSQAAASAAAPAPAATVAQRPSPVSVRQYQSAEAVPHNPLTAKRPVELAARPTRMPSATPLKLPPPAAIATIKTAPDTQKVPPLPPRRAPTPILIASAPTAAAAKPATAVEPAKPVPAEPPTKRPREAIAQVPQAQRAQARKAPLPPRRLRRPPTQLAEVSPQKQTPAPGKSRSNDTFASLISGGIGSKSSNDRMNVVAESLGVGVSLGSLSKTIQEAIAARLGGCWRLLRGQAGSEDLVVVLSVRFGLGSEVQEIQVIDKPLGPAGEAAVVRARQAVQKCNPMNKFGQLKLPADKYRDWREMRIRFDPQNIAG